MKILTEVLENRGFLHDASRSGGTLSQSPQKFSILTILHISRFICHRTEAHSKAIGFLGFFLLSKI
jgi:hypothetical protein